MLYVCRQSAANSKVWIWNLYGTTSLQLKTSPVSWANASSSFRSTPLTKSYVKQVQIAARSSTTQQWGQRFADWAILVSRLYFLGLVSPTIKCLIRPYWVWIMKSTCPIRQDSPFSTEMDKSCTSQSRYNMANHITICSDLQLTWHSLLSGSQLDASLT